MLLRADSGTEHFLPYAKKKVRELHDYMTRAGVGTFNKRIDVSDGTAIYINSLALQNGEFVDKVRITGGGYWSFFLSLPPKSLAVTITLVSSVFIPSSVPIAFLFNGVVGYHTLGVTTRTVRLTGPLGTVDVVGTLTLSDGGGSYTPQFNYLRKVWVNFPLPGDVAWNPPTDVVAAGIIDHTEVGALSIPTSVPWASTPQWTEVGGGSTLREYSDALIESMKTPATFSLPADWAELLRLYAAEEAQVAATKLALTFYRPVLKPDMGDDEGIFTSYGSYDQVDSVEVYGTLVLIIERGDPVISFTPDEWFDAGTTALSRDDLQWDDLPPDEPSGSQNVITSWIGARLGEGDISSADEEFRQALLTAAAAPPLLPVKAQG